MPYFGCHLSAAGGYRAMVNTAISIGADTVQFFTRNPRGSRAKAIDPADAQAAVEIMSAHSFGPVVAHGPYTMNLCTKDPEARAFAAQVLVKISAGPACCLAACTISTQAAMLARGCPLP